MSTLWVNVPREGPPPPHTFEDTHQRAKAFLAALEAQLRPLVLQALADRLAILAVLLGA